MDVDSSKFICPRCGGLIPHDHAPGAYPGAISRWDNKTEVCSACGADEGIAQYVAARSGADPATVVHPVFGMLQWAHIPEGWAGVGRAVQ
jgi:histidinol-phosphate/aromatic aminotransferase/cobyric acid decarboxylase-like protein